MEIKIGKYILRSDRYAMWIDTEYETKDKKGNLTGKTQIRRVAGYSRTWDNLLRSFIEVQHRDNDAQTVKELLKAFKQVAEDTEQLKKTALKNDFRIIRQIAKEKGVK